MKNKIFIKRLILLTIIITFIILLDNYVLAADPKIITTMKKSLDQIKAWIIKLATPAAAIAVGTGVFMKKFSFRR